jgi:hypothetical protein
LGAALSVLAATIAVPEFADAETVAREAARRCAEGAPALGASASDGACDGGAARRTRAV